MAVSTATSQSTKTDSSRDTRRLLPGRIAEHNAASSGALSVSGSWLLGDFAMFAWETYNQQR